MAWQPFFLDGPAGPLFAIYHSPAGEAPVQGDLVFIPPFGEEMNQARRMVGLQARRFAAIGVGVLLIDLTGTGDSAGDLAEARWQTWLDDIGAGLAWIEGNGRRPAGLWGLRLGGLLAMEVAAAERHRVPRVLLWHPVTSGRTMLTQILRLRVAAAMGHDAPRESTESLRQALSEGQLIEVAGYPLTGALTAAIEGVALEGLAPPPGCRVDWLELVPRAESPATPAARRIAGAWSEAGCEVSLKTVVGEPFWSVQSWEDIVLVPALWDATLAAWRDGQA